MADTIISGSRRIDVTRMIVLLGALKLELLGMKRRGPSVFSIVKREYALSGSKQVVFNKFALLVDAAKQGRDQ